MGLNTRAKRAGAALVVALSMIAPAAAQTTQTIKVPAGIGNFGQVNDKYYRGEQPEGRDYADLAALGVKMVIDLQRGGDEGEKAIVEQAGMKFVRIPMTTTDRPADKDVAQFLQLVNDPANQPVYVHCAGGRHRTGVMTAVYRMTNDKWDADQAYAEMKKFKFEGLFGHPELKDYVYEFFKKNAATTAAAGK